MTEPVSFNKRKLLPLLIIVGTIGIIFLLVISKPKPPEVPLKEKEWLVHAVEARPQSASPELVLIGTVESPFDSALSAAISADVEKVPKLEGDTVREGDLIVQLEAREWQWNLSQRQGELDDIRAQIDAEKNRHTADLTALAEEKTLLKLAEQAVTRRNKLNESQLVAQERIDEAESQRAQRALSLNTRQLAVNDHPARQAQLKARLDKAQAALRRAELDLERTRIRAPFDGVVTHIAVAPGERVQIGQTLARLYSTEQMEIRTQLPDRHAAEVRTALQSDQTIHARTRHLDQDIALELKRISPQSQTGGVDLLLAPTKSTSPLTLGATLSVKVSLPAQDNVVVVPQSALYGSDRVYVMKEGRLALVEVALIGKQYSATDGDQVLLPGDQFAVGDKIVTTQLPNAVTGLKVAERAVAPEQIKKTGAQ